MFDIRLRHNRGHRVGASEIERHLRPNTSLAPCVITYEEGADQRWVSEIYGTDSDGLSVMEPRGFNLSFGLVESGLLASKYGDVCTCQISFRTILSIHS